VAIDLDVDGERFGRRGCSGPRAAAGPSGQHRGRPL